MNPNNPDSNMNFFRPADLDSGTNASAGSSSAGYGSAGGNPAGYGSSSADSGYGASAGANPGSIGYSGAGAGYGGPSGAGAGGYRGSAGPGYGSPSGAGVGYGGPYGAGAGGYRGPAGPGYGNPSGTGPGYGSPYGAGPEYGYMDPPPRNPASVQAEIKRTRHDKEVPLYIIMIVLGLIACFILLVHDMRGDGLMAELREIFEENADLGSSDITGLVSAFIFATSIIFGVGALLLLVVSSLFSVYMLYADQMSYSVRVSERNFPEIYAKVREYTWLLGWKKEPEVYVQQMNGQINAFSSWIPGKVFVQLNAEIVDLAYLEHKDFDTINFIMAHEFGHAYLHHVQLYYSIWPMLVSFIPFIGSGILYNLLSRSREYSADRVAQALTGGVAQEDCMMMLGTGRHLYKYMNSREYIRDICSQHNSIEFFARWCTNLFASHPIMPFRVNAILDPSKKSGRLI